jgi:hypothetical protein
MKGRSNPLKFTQGPPKIPYSMYSALLVPDQIPPLKYG